MDKIKKTVRWAYNLTHRPSIGETLSLQVAWAEVVWHGTVALKREAVQTAKVVEIEKFYNMYIIWCEDGTGYMGNWNLD